MHHSLSGCSLTPATEQTPCIPSTSTAAEMQQISKSGSRLHLNTKHKAPDTVEEILRRRRLLPQRDTMLQSIIIWRHRSGGEVGVPFSRAHHRNRPCRPTSLDIIFSLHWMKDEDEEVLPASGHAQETIQIQNNFVCTTQLCIIPFCIPLFLQINGLQGFFPVYEICLADIFQVNMSPEHGCKYRM